MGNKKVNILLLIILASFVRLNAESTYYAIVDKVGNLITVVPTDADGVVEEDLPLEIKNDEWAKYLNKKSSSCNTSAVELFENANYSCNSKGISSLEEDYPFGAWGVNTVGNLYLYGNNLVDVDFLENITDINGLTYLHKNKLINVNGLKNLENTTNSFYLNDNIDLIDISGLSSLKNIGINLFLNNTAIKDYSPLGNLGSVTGSITIDPLEGDEIFPSSGAWCDNGVFLKLDGGYDMGQKALEACGINKENFTDRFWAKYLNSKSSICNSSALELKNGTSYSCGGIIRTSDKDFPEGSWGISTANTIQLYSNQLENLDFLSNIEAIVSHAYFSNNKLVDVNGLSKLKNVGGLLYIQDNTTLNDITGLSSLESVGSNLVLNNTAVKDYSPLSNLGSVSGVITIDPLEGDEIFPSSGAWCDNNVFFKLDGGYDMGQKALEACGINKENFTDRFWAKYLNSKSSICNSSALELKNGTSYSCGGIIRTSDKDFPEGSWGISTANTIQLYSNQLENLDFLSNIEAIVSHAYFSNNKLVDVNGLSKLKNVGGLLYIQDNTTLNDITGLSSLESVGSNLVLNNTAVKDYSPLSNLGSVSGVITIDPLEGDEIFPSSGAWCDNNVFFKLDGGYDMGQKALEACGINKENFTNRFWAKYLNSKSSICNSSALELKNGTSYSCGGIIRPYDKDFPEGSWGISTASTIQLQSNQLENLDFLSNIETIVNHAYFSTNKLVDVNGLSKLKNVGGVLYIQDNTTLNDITGLSSLESVGSNFFIKNTAVKDYSPLSNLANVTGIIAIDALEGGEIFPSSGAWCDNGVFLKLDGGYDMGQKALEACGINKENFTNRFWAKYLNSKSSICNSSALELKNGTSYVCNGFIRTSDKDFPEGSWGISTASTIQLHSNQLENIDFLSNIETISSHALLNNNKLVNINALSKLKSVGGLFYLQDNTTLNDITGLSSLESVGNNFVIKNTAVKDYSPLSNLANVTGIITIDALEGGEIFPPSGAWCDNFIYNKLSTGKEIAKEFCGH